MTNHLRPPRRIVATAMVGGLLFLAACGDDEEPAPATEPAGTNMTEDTMMTDDTTMSEDTMMTEDTMMDEQMTDTTSAP